MIALDPAQPRDASTARVVACFQNRAPSRRVGAVRLAVLFVLIAAITSGGCRWIAGYKPGTSTRRDAADDAIAKNDLADFRDAPPIDHGRDDLTDILGTPDSGPLVCAFLKEQPTSDAITQLWIGSDGHRYAATARQVFEQSSPASKWTPLSGDPFDKTAITGLTGNAEWIVAVTQSDNIAEKGTIQAWGRDNNSSHSEAFKEFRPIGVAIHDGVIYAATSKALLQTALPGSGNINKPEKVEGMKTLLNDESFRTLWSDGEHVWIAGGSKTAGTIRVYDPDPSATKPWESFPEGAKAWVAGWGAHRNEVVIAPQAASHYTPGPGWIPRKLSMSKASLNAVWGRSAGDVFIVGDAGEFWRYRSDGSWNAVTGPKVPKLSDKDLIAAYGHDHSLLIATRSRNTETGELLECTIP